MDNYFDILINSLQSTFLISLTSEYAWFAALEFGNYSMPLATLMALAGSLAGMCLNYAAGYYLSRSREKWFRFSDAAFLRVKKILFRFSVLLLMPFLPFLNLLVLCLGLFRATPWIVFMFLAAGRIVYYAYFWFSHVG